MKDLKFNFDPIPFEGLRESMENFQRSIQLSLAKAGMIPKWVLDSSLRPLEMKLEQDGWQSVDPHELIPEERWIYQKWVLSSPLRWLKGLWK